MTNKFAQNVQGSDPSLLSRLESVAKEQQQFAKGTGGDPLYEPIPTFIKTFGEKIFSNGHNAWVVIGRDRPGNRLSGYGGKGHTGAGSIDVVVGRGSPLPQAFSKEGKRLWVDPDFKKDAARIYISQKADVDDYFNLAKGSVGLSKTKSCVAIKADAVRLISREGMKLITGGDPQNSQGGSIESILGIDLIAGNDSKGLEPMVKGKALIEALKRIVHHIDKLSGIVDSMLMTQMTFNTALTSHFHFSPFFGLPTSPSPPVVAAGIKANLDNLLQDKRSLVLFKNNLQMFKANYCLPSGKGWILSRYNNTN